MPDIIPNQKLEQFIKSPAEHIFHFYGKQNTQKSQIVQYTLNNIFNKVEVEYEKRVIWITAGYDQTNMVIEHLEKILGRLPLQKEIPSRNYSNARNIHILTQDLVINQSNDSTLEKPYVLVIDNAENIFSLHFSLALNNWRKELVEEWRVFLKNLIELNSNGFYLKVILISNEHILDLEDVENFLKYEENVNQKTVLLDLDTPTKVSKAVSNLTKKKKCSENECDGEIVKPSVELINKIFIDSSDLNYEQEKIYKFLKQPVDVEKRQYINVGDIIYQYGYGMELVEAINKFEKREYPGDGYIIAYIKEQFKKIIKLAKVVRGASNRAYKINTELIKLSKKRIELDKKVLEASNKAHRFNVKIIKRVYAVYNLISLFKKIVNDEQLKEFLNRAMIVFLCLPVRKTFSDVGDILRTYGYSNLLLEIIEKTEGSTDGSRNIDYYLSGFNKGFIDLFKSRNYVQCRMYILKGNIAYYNYPENFARAIDDYCEVFELNGCGLKAYRFLATYEIINVFFQLVERQWKSSLSAVEKEKIKKSVERLKEIFKKNKRISFFNEHPWKEYDLLKISLDLINWLKIQLWIFKPGVIFFKEQFSVVFFKGAHGGILDKLKGGYCAVNEEAFFERTIVARIKYYKLEAKLLINKSAQNNLLGKIKLLGFAELIRTAFCLYFLQPVSRFGNIPSKRAIYIKASNGYIKKLNSIREHLKCEPYWKFSIIYHLTKWLYFLSNAADSMDNLSSEVFSKDKIDAEKLIEINDDNFNASQSFGESLWRKAKIKELNGDITRLEVKQARNDKEKTAALKKRVDFYNEARKIYLTLNCGYQLEGILEKIEQTEVLLRDNFVFNNEYERVKK